MEKITVPLPLEDTSAAQAEVAALEAMYEAPSAGTPDVAVEPKPGHASILAASGIKEFGHRLNMTNEQKLRLGRAGTLLAAAALTAVLNNQGAVEMAYHAVTGHDEVAVVHHEEQDSRRAEMEVDFSDMVKDLTETDTAHTPTELPGTRPNDSSAVNNPDNSRQTYRLQFGADLNAVPIISVEGSLPPAA